MAKSLFGEIPGISLPFARTKLNEALGKIYDETDWSFQTQYANWLTPALVATGTVTVAQYNNQVIGDSAASSIWATTPRITSLQFRNPSYSLYNITTYDITSNPPFGTLTLDRPWLEPVTGAGQPYQMYQAYFPVPVADFRKFLEIRDTTNNAPVNFWDLSQADLSLMDSQRLTFGPAVPTYAVQYGTDMRTGSSTLGYDMYEIWPHVLSNIAYSFSYKRRGPLLVNPADTVPYPLTEELVMWRAKEILYQFKEAQKGEQMLRGSGANWLMLAEFAQREYKGKDGVGGLLKKIRAIDANLHRDFVTRRNAVRPAPSDGYSPMGGGLVNIGRGNF